LSSRRDIQKHGLYAFVETQYNMLSLMPCALLQDKEKNAEVSIRVSYRTIAIAIE
jgi:hypothetical protein